MIQKENLQKLFEFDADFKLWYESSEKYYDINNEDGSDIPDDEFDELTESLKEKYLQIHNENKHNEITDSILKFVMDGIQTDNGLVEATSEQISLEKIKYKGSQVTSEIQKFFKKGKAYNTSQIMYVGPKEDGNSIKVKFNIDSENNYTLTLIQTRGGQDLTELLKHNLDIIALPKRLKEMTSQYNRKFPIIHGELVLAKDIYKNKYADEYENVRNAVSGVLKKNVNDLRFIAFSDGKSPYNINFNVWETLTPGTNLELYFKQKFKNDGYPFQVDGLVVGFKVKDEDFEIKGKYPLNMVAIKFKAESVKTVVTDINWTIKKSGKLTPVLEVKAVQLDGTTVTAASCYSYSFLKTKRIGIGSVITIHKSGDIIPTVDKVLSYSTEMKLPNYDFTEKGKHIFVMNSEEQKEQKFILGLKLLQLDGIGPVVSTKIGKIVDFNIISLFDNTFKPDIRIMLGSDSANWNRFEQFYNIKNLPLDNLIEILQIDNCGHVLSRKFGLIMTTKPGEMAIDTKGMNKELLKEVCGSGGKYNILIKESIAKLQSFGVKVIKPIQVSEDSFSFEMTGNPPGMTKQEFINQLKIKSPNCVHTTLTKETTYLFVEDVNGNSGKINKGRKYNTKIMSYEEALKHNF